MRENVIDGIAGRLRDLAEQAGSISALSRSCDMPQSTLSGYVNGAREPRASDLVTIARATGVNIEWLATGEGPMRPDPVCGSGAFQVKPGAVDVVVANPPFAGEKKDSHTVLLSSQFGAPVKGPEIAFTRDNSTGYPGNPNWEPQFPVPRPNQEPDPGQIAPPLESTAPAPPPPSEPLRAPVLNSLDHALMGLISEGISRIYKELNARIGPRELGELMAEMYDDIASATDDPEERRTMVKLAVSQHRKAMTTPGAMTAQGKQSA